MTKSIDARSMCLLPIMCIGFLLSAAGDCAASEIVLQPGAEGKDSYVTNALGWSDNNYGDNEYFQIMGIATQSAAFIEFDVSSIPAGSTIDSATISLWAEYLDGTIYFDPVVASWDEMTITWNNMPGNWAPTIAWEFSRCYPGCVLSFDITEIVQVWVDEFNHGLRIIADSGNVSFMMASSDNLTYPHPMLTVNYSEPLGSDESTWGAIKTLYR